MADSEEESGPTQEPQVPQNYGTYQSRAHKFAALFMMTAGGRNTAMFPMMFIFYGGAPFLLAYLTLLATVAMPMMQLESNLAQFSGDGNCGIFTAVPLFLGMGYALTFYVVLHVVADSMPLSDVLIQMSGMEDIFPWSGGHCPGGWSANNRTCYAIKPGSTLCRSVRSRLSGSYQRRELTEGVPLLRGDLVVLVPSRAYYNETATCTPDLYTPAPVYDFRHQHSWVDASFEHIRVQPLLCIAALWLLVFAVAHRGFVGIKNFFYVMLLLHVTTTVMLLSRAALMEGSSTGLNAFLHAEWSYIANVEMWFRALATCLESVGITGTIYLGVQRFNAFKNMFHEDAMFVLVADTASKGIVTTMAFLYLGHVSSSVDIDVSTLIDTRYNFIVSITPQAISLAPDSEFWSQIYLLWLVSMMLPKFLIVPDIVIEALSASHPLILMHRGAVHFCICTFMFVISIAACSPGGARVVSVLGYTQDNGFRLLMVAMETVIILQFYGFRRLSLSSRMMTNKAPSTFVKVCWTSIIPVTVAALMWCKAAFTAWDGCPVVLAFVIAWFEMVEFSFIPVFAAVFLVCSQVKLKNSLDPLPTWIPLDWENAMVYRQQVLVEDIDRLKREADLDKSSLPACRTEVAPDKVRRHSHKRRQSSTTPSLKSTSEHFATHQYVPSDPTKCGGTPGDGRERNSDETRRKRKSKKKRALQKVVPESGTTHVSQRLSTLRRLASRAREAVFQHKKPTAMVISSARPITLAPSIPPAAGIPVIVDNIDHAPALTAQNDSGDTIDNQDLVIDSAAQNFPFASAPPIGSISLKNLAQQDVSSLKSVPSHCDAAQKYPTQQRLSERLEPSGEERRHGPYVLASPQEDAKLVVTHKGARKSAWSTKSVAHGAQHAALEVKRASEASKAQVVSGPAQQPVNKPATQGATEQNAPLKQSQHGPPLTKPFKGRWSAFKKPSSRKHSTSLKSSSSSQKAPPAFATADAKPLRPLAPSGTSIDHVTAAPPGVATSAPSSEKHGEDKTRKQPKLKQTVNKVAQPGDESTAEKAFPKQGEDLKLLTKISSRVHSPTKEGALAANIFPDGKPFGPNPSGKCPQLPGGTELASRLASNTKAADTTHFSQAVTLHDKCEAVTREHHQHHTRAAPQKAVEQKEMNAAGVPMAQQNAGSPSQPQTGQTDSSETRKASSGRTSNLLSKIAAHRARWKRQRSKKHLDTNVDANPSGATAGRAQTPKASLATQSLASLGLLSMAHNNASHAPKTARVPIQRQDAAAPAERRAVSSASVPEMSQQAAIEGTPHSVTSLAQEADVAAGAGKDGVEADAAATQTAQTAQTAAEQRDTSRRSGGQRKRSKQSKKHPDTSSLETA